MQDQLLALRVQVIGDRIGKDETKPAGLPTKQELVQHGRNVEKAQFSPSWSRCESRGSGKARDLLHATSLIVSRTAQSRGRASLCQKSNRADQNVAFPRGARGTWETSKRPNRRHQIALQLAGVGEPRLDLVTEPARVTTRKMAV